MRPTKIVVIGAGSASFGPGLLGDVFSTPELAGSALGLVDVDRDSLELMAAVARRMNEATGLGLTIEAATERTRALPEAECVIVSVLIDPLVNDIETAERVLDELLAVHADYLPQFAA